MTGLYRILVLAGTMEARELCHRLSSAEGFEVTASIAGVTSSPRPYPVPVRRGGFGGPAGLAEYLLDGRYNLLVDATHPFAENISANAEAAIQRTGTMLAQLERPPWKPRDGDNWFEFETLDAAIQALPAGSRVFAPLGAARMQLSLRPVLTRRRDVEFVLRSMVPLGDVPANVVAQLVAGPGNEYDDEIDLLRRYECTCLLCRNSGGRAGFPKLEACAQLGLPVFLLSRPSRSSPEQGTPVFDSVDKLVAWITGFARHSVSH